MRLKIALPIVFMLVMAAMPAMADTVTMQWTGQTSGVGVPTSIGTYYMSPYYVQINGAAAIPLFCKDAAHTIGTSEYTAWVTTSNDTDFSHTYLFTGDDEETKELYMQIAWLEGQFGSQDLANKKAIQEAMWSYSRPDMVLSTAAQGWKDDAELASNWQNAPYFEIYTDIAGNNQEFDKVPEPSLALLLGLAGLGITGLMFRRKK